MGEFPSDKDVGGAWAAHILGELFEAWPRRLDFNAMDVAAATMSPKDEPEDLFDGLVNWLYLNGYIHIGQQGPEGSALLVSLTSYGFSVLGQKPKGLDQPLGTKLRSAAASIGSETKSAAISELIGTLVGAAAKQFIN